MFKNKYQLLPFIFNLYMLRHNGFSCAFLSCMLRNDGSFSFSSLGRKDTRKGEWVGRGPFPSLQQLSYLICHQLILFTLLSSGVNTLTSLNTLQRLFVEPAKSNKEIVNPSVASILSYL